MSSLERRRAEVPGLPPGWRREEIVRKSGLSAGKSDVYYISPDGRKVRSKPQMARLLGEKTDLSNFDFRTGKILQMNIHKKRKRDENGNVNKPVKRRRTDVDDDGIVGDQAYNHSGIRPDSSLVLPIRQTASIFKQPVTVIRNHPDSRTRTDLKHGSQEPPRQLFWEKRLQGLTASDIFGETMSLLQLPHAIQGASPELLCSENLLQSIAAALHLSNHPVTGQNVSKTLLQRNPGVNMNTEQPLIQNVVISDLDIQKQEFKVQEARRRLQHALNQAAQATCVQ